MKKLFMSEYLNYVFQKKVWIVENIYMIKIMQLYYSSYNKKFISHTFFTDAIKNSSFPIFLYHVNNLNDKILYHSQVHGVKHILNVTFFSFLIASFPCNLALPCTTHDSCVLIQFHFFFLIFCLFPN